MVDRSLLEQNRSGVRISLRRYVLPSVDVTWGVFLKFFSAVSSMHNGRYPDAELGWRFPDEKDKRRVHGRQEKEFGSLQNANLLHETEKRAM